jgi:hypothetical protein
MPTFLTPIQDSFGIPTLSEKAREEIKETQVGKKEVKLSLFADDMILYLKDPKKSTKNFWKS